MNTWTKIKLGLGVCAITLIVILFSMWRIAANNYKVEKANRETLEQQLKVAQAETDRLIKYNKSIEKAMKEIAENVKNSAYEIIEKKGATYYGIAMSVRRICEAIVRDEKTILPVSSIQHDNHGISDVALSMPAIVGKDGVEGTVPISMNEDEEKALKVSADTLKGVISEVALER